MKSVKYLILSLLMATSVAPVMQAKIYDPSMPLLEQLSKNPHFKNIVLGGFAVLAGLVAWFWWKKPVNHVTPQTIKDSFDYSLEVAHKKLEAAKSGSGEKNIEDFIIELKKIRDAWQTMRTPERCEQLKQLAQKAGAAIGARKRALRNIEESLSQNPKLSDEDKEKRQAVVTELIDALEERGREIGRIFDVLLKVQSA